MSRGTGRIPTVIGNRGKVAVGTGLAGTAVTALSNAPDRLTHLWRQRYPSVAVTGMTGVGKTALVNRLTKHAEQEDAAEVGSATLEKRTRRGRRLRGFRFRVVPGENAATRLGALDEVFHDEPVDGVLHLVANGYATPRRTGGTSGSAEATREAQLAAELENWAITSHRIASLAVRREYPTWLIIAVTKTDLYPGEIDDVVRSYSPVSGTPFGDKLDELRALTGGAKLSIDVLPVSAEDDGLLAAIDRRMSQLSGHV